MNCCRNHEMPPTYSVRIGRKTSDADPCDKCVSLGTAPETVVSDGTPVAAEL